jgi:hypothetical protein
LFQAMTSCPPEFTPEIRRRIIEAIQVAYAEADERYAPDRGVGDRAYGIIVYDVLTFRLMHDVASLPPVAFRWTAEGPSLWISALHIRWNKVGRGRAGESPRVSFPRPSRSSAEMALENQQLSLWAATQGEVLAELAHWIVCHMGNPRDGLRAVYLAAPIESDGERITGWREVIPIWSADDLDSEFPALAPTIGLPEPDALPEFDLSLIDEASDSDAAG